jgi:anaerobic ribonucleoside-triphosphate reductase activating protein
MNLVIFTGYTYERLMDLMHERPELFELLTFADILIDGPFIMAKKSLEIKFRGSTNQRIIDVQESLMQGHVVLHQIQLDEMKVRPDLVMA